MNIQDAITEMLVAIGEANEGIDAISQTETDIWAVSFETGQQVDIQVDIPHERLTLYSQLGEVHASERLRILETLMAYNMLALDTGGMRMGLSGDGATCYLIGDCALPLVSEAKLDEMLFNISALTPGWTRFVTTGSMEEGGAKGADGAGPAEMMIRV